MAAQPISQTTPVLYVDNAAKLSQSLGRPIRPGESFRAAFLVGYFDSIDQMNAVYDRYRGSTGLEVNADGWKLVK